MRNINQIVKFEKLVKLYIKMFLSVIYTEQILNLFLTFTYNIEH